MMRHALDIQHYTSTQTFAQEQQKLFGSLWLFAGFTSMVAQRNQFFTRQLTGIPVLVQRTAAGIRAFINQCPHRKSAIQTAPEGVRPLVCPYHAWTFGAEGELRSTPNPALYQFSDVEKSELCLDKLQIQLVGQFIFVNFSNEPLPLSEQFSEDYLAQLETVSGHLDSQIVYSCHRVRYNWKLNMENVKDYNHVPFIHPKTFLPLLKSPPATPPVALPSVVEQLRTAQPPRLSALSYFGRGTLNRPASWFAKGCETYGEGAFYYSWYLYPNVNFCSVQGEHFLLQQYDPVAPGETDYHLWMMTAKRKDIAADFTALLSGLIRGERRVIAEDTQVLEKMQTGFGGRSARVTHGDYESMLVAQHLWYRANVLGEAL
ncbi:aromatic ring-hydroxylating dioxygenase subunit alpha [Pseudomonas chlororaphis subsp. aurantiaca]|uniref:aromatic ring-hydroxylating oxygenase subunit alpha n=1 Tax=Pseudomonas chlororaphis TaxID=587753 RepID=UPI0027DB2A14|nr:aromatic ring-hydroxylating dioxygenase subunit alpha [Pseudomonas chlororaphis]WMI97602.1 aromatic ring-hydroxylating dioxygenase subunit alpha [Pseudomonas chlororaphis subsp. aurantiaca]